MFRVGAGEFVILLVLLAAFVLPLAALVVWVLVRGRKKPGSSPPS